MNKTDKRLLEGVLGGLGFVGAQFAKNPAVTVGVSFTALLLSTTAIILDTWPEEEPMGNNPPKLPFKEEENKEKVLAPSPSGPVLRFEF